MVVLVTYPNPATAPPVGTALPARMVSVYITYNSLDYQFSDTCLSLIAVCNSGCANGGTCTGPATCTCVAGWSGTSCRNGE